MASLESSPTLNTGHGFNLEDVYQGTLLQLQRMTVDGRLSQSEYDTVTQTQSPLDVIHTLQHALEVGSTLLQSVLQITEARAQNSKNALARRALAARARANP